MTASPFWKDKRVLVTGGAGFIGSHLSEALLDNGARLRVADSLQRGSSNYDGEYLERIQWFESDLLDPEACIKASADSDVVLHLAAKVAGVAFNSAHPAEMFQANARLSLNMLEAIRKNDVERSLIVSSACVYPRSPIIPTPETEGFKDDPEPSNFGYGWAKRLAEVESRAYHEEYGLKIAVVRPYNTYGPRDHFGSRAGHVIPSLISRVLRRENPLVVWGNGNQSRSFVYVTDVVQGMLLATEKYPFADPINIGNAEEIKIRDLVQLILDSSGFALKTVFDETKPSGQERRCPDLSKAREKLAYLPNVMLRDGIKKTIEWYSQTAVASQAIG